jgi:hypothetical protein
MVTTSGTESAGPLQLVLKMYSDFARKYTSITDIYLPHSTVGSHDSLCTGANPTSRCGHSDETSHCSIPSR